MEQLLIIKLVVGLLMLVTLVFFILNYRLCKDVLTKAQKFKTFSMSFIANFFDTFGIGSFSSFFAMRNFLKLMPDNKTYNGSLVVQAALPTAVQSILFLGLVQVDTLMLVVSCVSIAIGGIISGYLINRVSRQGILYVMLITFMISAALLILNKFNLLNIGGELTYVRGDKLIILAVVMLLAGMLPAFGVGYYSIVLVIIFMLGISPIVAYPIMTTASAVQMPMTAIPMIKSHKFLSFSSLLMTIAGLLAVAIAAPVISKINSAELKWILLIVLIYNITQLLKQMSKAKQQ